MTQSLSGALLPPNIAICPRCLQIVGTASIPKGWSVKFGHNCPVSKRSRMLKAKSTKKMQA